MDENQQKLIIDIIRMLKKYKYLIHNSPKNKEYKGYLKDINLIKNLKKEIFYDELKEFIDKTEFDKKKSILNEINNFEEITNSITQSKFNDTNEMLKCLNNNKKYYVINTSIWCKICKNEKKDEEGIKFYFQENKIFLILNDKEEIIFNINNIIIKK